jgi:arylsulfatase A
MLSRLCHLVLFALAILSFAPASFAATASSSRPNIVLIMADDFGYECVTANGGQSYQTPQLDRLAATGMRFEQCHVQPLCTPTRVQLMTGQYNVRNYIEFGSMDPKATTFAHVLKGAGYATGICGKWQLGVASDSPQRFGFDDAFLWHHMRRESRYPSPGFEHNGVAKDYKGGYGPKVVNDFALDFITRHKDRPFFLYYPMLLTHSPFQPTPDGADWDPSAGERGNNHAKNFAGMVAYMDKMVGRLVARLDELGLRDNTLVVFLGDNGTGVDITSKFKGQSYAGGKGRSTARGTHVPLIANWPGKISAGKVNGDLVASVDLLPTICAAAGVTVPSTIPPDGQSFLPQLLGNKSAPREWAYFWYAPDGGAKPKYEFAMTTEYKLYRDGTFFDLGADRFEEKPLRADKLSGAAAAAALKLQAALDQYATARPAKLLEPLVTAKQAKKAERQKKKK